MRAHAALDVQHVARHRNAAGGGRRFRRQDISHRKPPNLNVVAVTTVIAVTAVRAVTAVTALIAVVAITAVIAVTAVTAVTAVVAG